MKRKDFKEINGSNLEEMRLGNCKLTLNDFKILESDQWLNDEIINSYLSIIQKKTESTIILSTFTLNFNTQKFNHRILKSIPKNIMTYNKIVLPINHSAHWFFVEVDIPKKKILYL